MRLAKCRRTAIEHGRRQVRVMYNTIAATEVRPSSTIVAYGKQVTSGGGVKQRVRISFVNRCREHKVCKRDEPDDSDFDSYHRGMHPQRVRVSPPLTIPRCYVEGGVLIIRQSRTYTYVLYCTYDFDFHSQFVYFFG